MSFFIRKNNTSHSHSNRKRKKVHGVETKLDRNENYISKNKVNSSGMDEIISSDSDVSKHEKSFEDFSSDEETQQEKKLRLTKKYLEQIEKEETEKQPHIIKDAIASRLKEEALQEVGQLQKKVAHEYENETPVFVHILRGHKLSITCLTLSSDEKFLYTGSKDCSVIKWNMETTKKVKVIPGGRKGTEKTHCGHTGHVLSIALSSDDKFLATGCNNHVINIWDPDTMKLIKTFKGHKDSIRGLVFQKGSHQLISASADRTLKLWNLDEMGYVETLFGHQDGITSIADFFGGKIISSGGRDNTVRIWKILEESQLVFQGHGASIDYVCASGLRHFVSGADDGTICLWGIQKKKPLFKLPEAHGRDEETNEPHWITAVSALANTDLLASGSHNGYIYLWRRNDDQLSIQKVSSIPVKGFVNALCFSPSGKFLIAGIGQEHRFGRWWQNKEAKNAVVIYSWSNKL